MQEECELALEGGFNIVVLTFVNIFVEFIVHFDWNSLFHLFFDLTF